jgi:hypothetical protein
MDALVTRKVLKDEVVLIEGVDSKAEARRKARSTREDNIQFSHDLHVEEVNDVEME